MLFFKYQALGNDFIIVEDTGIDKKDVLAKTLCDRHFGIGADGIIYLDLSDTPFMDIYNADGSRALMCGNGLRCVAWHLVDCEYVKESHFFIDTLSGKKEVYVDKKDMNIQIDMGAPVFDVDKIPVAFYEADVLLRPVIIGGVTYKISCVSMGNPHTCIFVDEIDDKAFADICDFFRENAWFPCGTNVELISVIDKKNIKMRVWERGVGETYACGSGACAAQVISVLCGYTNEEASVYAKYGKLVVRWDREINKVFLTGDACFVYKGYI